MKNKDKGQFLAEIKMIGKQKEFSGLFGEMINPVNMIKSVDDVLDTRKTSYNYAFVKCCERNGLKGIDNIHKDLDEIWLGCKQEFDFMKDVLSNLATGLLGGLIGKYQARFREKWDLYIQKTIDYARTLDDKEL